jgi:hypothetical protein
MLENKNKEGNREILQGKDIVKVVISLQLQWCSHVKKCKSKEYQNK